MAAHYLVGDRLHERLDVATTLTIRRGRGGGLLGRFGHLLEQLGVFEGVGLGLEIAIPFAEQAVAAEVTILKASGEPGVGDPEVRLEPDQLGGLFVVIVFDVSELLGEDQDPAVGVDDLGLEVGVFKVAAVGDRAVVGEDDRIGIFHVGEHRVGEILAAGGLVRGDRHLAEENLELGHRALRDRLVGDGEGGRVGRVAVDAGADVRPGLHHGEVEQDLARPFPLAGNLLAFHVHHAEVVGLHEAFRHAGRRAEDAVLAETVTDVAVVGRGETLRVDAPANLAHLLPQRPLAHPRTARRAQPLCSPLLGSRPVVSYQSVFRCSARAQTEIRSSRQAQ